MNAETAASDLMHCENTSGFNIAWLDAVFVAVSHWMHKKATKQKKSATSLEDTAQMLARCIRFPMLTNDFLHFVTPQVRATAAAAGLRPVCLMVLKILCSSNYRITKLNAVFMPCCLV